VAGSHLSLRDLHAHRACGAARGTLRAGKGALMSMLVTRRVFMQSAASTLAAFVLPLRLAAATDEGKAFAPNAFVAIDNDGSVTLTVQRSEMGQGIRTALAMILCEELDADWHRVRV